MSDEEWYAIIEDKYNSTRNIEWFINLYTIDLRTGEKLMPINAGNHETKFKWQKRYYSNLR